MFDLHKTQELAEMFASPREARDAGWLKRFYLAAWSASLEVGTPQAFQGPDYFPYLRLQLPAPGQPFDSNSLANVAPQLVEDGMGAALFASTGATEPEFVFSMGVLDSLLTYDWPEGDPADMEDIVRLGTRQAETEGLQSFVMKEETEVLIGSPSANLLPPHTARALYRHLTEGWKLAEPRVALMINPATAPTRSLVINKKMSQFPSREVAAVQGRMLLWYLPPNRGLLVMPEDWEDSSMRPLREFFPAEDSAPTGSGIPAA